MAGFVGPHGAGKSTTSRTLIEGPTFMPSLTGRRSLRALSVLGGHDVSSLEATLELVGMATAVANPTARPGAPGR